MQCPAPRKLQNLIPTKPTKTRHLAGRGMRGTRESSHTTPRRLASRARVWKLARNHRRFIGAAPAVVRCPPHGAIRAPPATPPHRTKLPRGP